MTETQITLRADNLPAVPGEKIDPMLMIQQALSSGASPEIVKQMLDLRDRVKAEQSREAFIAAMHAAQSEMPLVKKDAFNSHTRSDFINIHTMQRAMKPVYERHGFTVSCSEGVPPRDGWLRVSMVVRHTGGHSETYFRDGPIDNKGLKGNDAKTELHGTQSTFTYLQRHLLQEIFAVVVIGKDDDDGNGGAAPTISEPEYIALAGLRDQLNKATQARFDEWLKTAHGIDSLADLPAASFDRVKQFLAAKVGAK